MNKIQKILLGVFAAAVIGIVALSVNAASIGYHLSVYVSNNVATTTVTTNYPSTNVAGVATIYTQLSTNIATNSMACVIPSDEMTYIIISNATASNVTVSAQNPVIGTKGIVIGAASTLTFPIGNASSVPRTLYATPSIAFSATGGTNLLEVEQGVNVKGP